MNKILRAYGPTGRSEDESQWNWCPDEPVGYNGMVCGNACDCGCNRSFRGIGSTKSTTKAIVEEVTEGEFLRFRRQLYNRTLVAWGGHDSIAHAAVRDFDTLSKILSKHAVGTILQVRITNNSVELITDV